jgi:hypothetical protein
MPRSGTSLMMQMLQAGGLPVLADGRRFADRHNPRGYFEDERARRLAQDASWIGEARGKALKIIYRLVPHLPPTLEYRIVFMDRDLNEVYDSQRDMLEAARDPAAAQHRGITIRALSLDLDAARKWLAAQPNIRCLTVPFQDLVANPDAWAPRIAQFLDGHLDEPAMAAAIDPALYRHHAR